MRTTHKAIGLTLLLIVAISAFRLVRSNFVKVSSHQNNALWCQSQYFRGFQPTTGAKLTDREMSAFCEVLRRNSIRYAFMFAGPFDTNGHLPDYAFSSIAVTSVRTIQRECPGVVVLPWVGGIVNKTVFMDNALWVSNAVLETAKLLRTLETPGVHVNFEFFTYQISDEVYPGLHGIERYGDDEINFFRKLRARLPQAFLSTVVVSTAPQTVPWKRKNTVTEISELTKVVDQIAILCFDTSIKDRGVFTESVKHQLQDVRLWKKPEATHTQFLFGVGTFINKEELWKFRDLETESITNALQTLKPLLNEMEGDGRPLIDGLAIFADWTTDPDEWQELRANWINP